jgi:hypothetical protein
LRQLEGQEASDDEIDAALDIVAEKKIEESKVSKKSQATDAEKAGAV